MKTQITYTKDEFVPQVDGTARGSYVKTLNSLTIVTNKDDMPRINAIFLLSGWHMDTVTFPPEGSCS